MPVTPNAGKFLPYKDKDLPKVNAQRRALSLVQISTIPLLSKGSVLFVTEESSHSEPNSCYNCWMYNSRDSTCRVISPTVKIKKLTWPTVSDSSSKPIEYWPVCGLHDWGKPNNERPIHTSSNDPDDIGLCWVNAPDVGQSLGGSNCGGRSGGDDCDHYITKSLDKRDAESGFCRVLQTTVGGGDCCAAWEDDDLLDWQKAQTLIDTIDSEKGKVNTPNPLLR